MAGKIMRQMKGITIIMGCTFGLSSPTIAAHEQPLLIEANEMEEAPKTAKNRVIFGEFIRLYYQERKVREAFETYVTEDYIQHNPGIADGREAAIAWLERMTTGSAVTMDIRRVLVDGEFAVVHLIGRQGPDDPGHAIMNIFRIEDGLIAEHWDVTQAIPAETKSGRSM